MSSSCFYQANSPGVYEREARIKQFDLSQTPCSQTLQPVSSFIDDLTSIITLHGCHSVLDLVNVRANGESMDVNNEALLGSRLICSDHFHTLVMNWELGHDKIKNLRQIRLKNDCTVVKCPLSHEKTVAASKSRIVSKAMCIEYLRREGILVPPGTQLCRRHQGLMKSGHDQFRGQLDTEFDATGEIAMEMDDPIDTFPDSHDNIDDCDEFPTRIERNLEAEVVSAVTQLVNAIGGDRVLTRGQWNNLAENTKRKKSSLARSIFRAVCEVITPDGKDDLYERATSQARNNEDNKLAERIFDSIDHRFSSASTTREKVEILSLVSDLGLTMKETIQCIPSATLHYLNLAKNHNRGGVDFDKNFRRERADEKKTDRYLDFLARSNCLVTLPWGDTLVCRSDGSKVPVASVARRFTYSRIHRMYIRDLENTNEMNLKMSRGSTTRILKAFARRKNERMQCVDEFAVDAYEGWRRLTDVVDELKALHGLIGDDEERALKRWIRISRSHLEGNLEGEYLSEVCETSNVRQHCSRFSLSDKDRKCYASECDHIHDGVCTNCDQLDLLLEHLSSLTDRLANEFKTSASPKYSRIQRLQQMTDFSCSHIRAYQSHLLRTALSNHGRTVIVDSLQEGEALITLDFGMKILPEKAIEGQSDFYAKRGITIHISHALAKIGGKMADHVFAHTLDETKQDGPLVYGIVRHTLGILEKKGISKVYLRSDNAGAYKSGALISSLFNLSTPSMTIAGYHFSEAQSGKGCCDRACAHCKRKLREWIASGNNIRNAYDIYKALTVDQETIKGLSTYFCTFVDSSTKKTFSNLLPGVSQFYSFEFDDAGIRSRCQFGIGEGNVTRKDKLPALNCTLSIEEEGGHTDDSFWSNIESKDKEEKDSVVDEEESYDDEMLHCSTHGCTATFRSIRWLQHHETIGKHVFVARKETMTDKAIDKFNELIETRETARIAITEQVETFNGNGIGYDHKQGWSLKGARVNEALNATARQLAEQYFNVQRALIPPKRAEPAVMRKRLEEAKKPSSNEYLLDFAKIPSEKQLQSLFSRLEQTRIKGPKSTSAKAAKVPKITKGAVQSTNKSTKSTCSVRSAKGGTRKRNVVVDSEESESNGEYDAEEEVGEEEEFDKEDEDSFMRKIIEEESHEIFL